MSALQSAPQRVQAAGTNSNGAQFIALKQSGSEEAARILRERISANLHGFLLDPAKRDKALAVAAKLSIDLSVHAVHSLMNKEI